MCAITMFAQCLVEKVVANRTCSLLHLFTLRQNSVTCVDHHPPIHHHQYSSVLLEVWCNRQRAQKQNDKQLNLTPNHACCGVVSESHERDAKILRLCLNKHSYCLSFQLLRNYNR